MRTRIDQTAPSITYTAGWVQDESSRPWSGGSARYSTAAGAQATFTFTGTSVSWIGARGPPTGIARVLLDGVLVAEVDTYKTTEEIQANVFSATGLAAGNHTLTIEVTGLKNAASTDAYIVVDAFDVNPNYNVTTALTANGPANVYWREFERGYVYVNPTLVDVASVTLPQASRQLTHDNLNFPRDSIPSARAISLNSHHAAILLKTLARFEETSPSVIATAGWVQDGSSRPWSGGTAAYSTTAGARATFTFTGTSVNWIGMRGPQTGIARVVLDGVLVAEVDTYKTTEEIQANAFRATGLAAGSHTLTIEVTGLKNAASTGTYIVADAFDVTQ
jgi:predicted carbohydrate-binding protein with CBM5 and CBM33 domain